MPEIQHNGDGFSYILEIYRQGFENQLETKAEFTDWRTHEYFYPVGGQVYEPYIIILRAKNSYGFALQTAARVLGFTAEDGEL